MKGKSFFQLYKKKGKVFSKESIVFLDNLKEVEKFYLANEKKIKELGLITNDKKNLEKIFGRINSI